MQEKDVYLSAGEPLYVGILMDMPKRYGDVGLRVYDIVRQDYEKSGRLDRGIEFLVEHVDGAPAGRIKNVIDGYHKLADAGALVIVGPNHSDNNVALSEYADKRRVPLVALGATADHPSEYTFSISWGSCPDDAWLIASWLHRNKYRSVTVTWDSAFHCAEYLRYFRIAARRAGIQIISDRRIPVLMRDPNLDTIVKDTISRHRDLKPDAIVHFGTSDVAAYWAAQVNAAKWDVPRIMNGCFPMSWYPPLRAGFEGWVGVSAWDQDNPIRRAFHDRYVKRYPDDELVHPECVAHYRDAMTAALEGLCHAEILTPEGVKRGLETVRMVPAAIGSRRTVISFGRYDRRGHKGMDIVVLGRVRNGQIETEGYFEPIS